MPVMLNSAEVVALTPSGVCLHRAVVGQTVTHCGKPAEPLQSREAVHEHRFEDRMPACRKCFCTPRARDAVYRARGARRDGSCVVSAGKRVPGQSGKTHAFGLSESNEIVTVRPIFPALLPELRAHLRSMWQPGAPFFEVAPQMGHGPTQNPSKVVEWEATALDRGSLWWVAADMVDVLMAAAASVPDDVRGLDLQPLDTWGLVALEKPWVGVSATPGQPNVNVDAFLWGPAVLPPLMADRDGATGEPLATVSLSSYAAFPPATDLNVLGVGRWALDGLLWAPLGRSDWPLQDAIDQEPWRMPEQTRVSFSEDRRVLCALMTLLAHEGIAETRFGVPPRGVRRRMERAGDTSDKRFRIVTLRTLRERGEEKSETPGQAHDHRWIVTGHWRRQPYGPNRSLRRLQWISPFVKGPEDAPLRVKETIHAWRR